MKLSILICSVQKRLTQFSLLAEHLERQVQSKPVEILWLGDNKTMSVGEKRNKLVSLAKGEYICFVDDDDWVADDYVDEILQGIEKKPDCVCFNAIYSTDAGVVQPVDFSLKHILNVNEPGKPRIRVPNHLIPIKREYVLVTKFLEKSFGEDTDYSLRVRRLLKTEYKIEKQLYHYRFSEKNSETHRFAPPRPSPSREGVSLPNPSGKIDSHISESIENEITVTPFPHGKGRDRAVVMDVIIVSDATIGGMAMTQKCINSIAADNVNVIVLEKAERVKYNNADTFLQRQPFNYNQCLNDGALFGNAEHICFSNNDVVFPNGFVERVVEEMSPVDVLSFRNQFGFIRAEIISGFCFIMRRTAWNKIGKLNTNYKFWCADNVTSEQIKQHNLREGRSDMRVFHSTSVTLNKLNASTREEYTKECVKQFNKDYNKNVLGIK